MDRARREAARLGQIPLQTRRIAATVGGIVLGALLIATGAAPAQLIGAIVVGGALAIARGGLFADVWLSDPIAAGTALWRRIRQATPAWAWPATVPH